MAGKVERTGNNTPHILFASQLIDDVKVGGGDRKDELALAVGRLRRGLLKRNYIPGDKLPARLDPLKLLEGNVLLVDIHDGALRGSDLDGGLDTHIKHAFPLDLDQPLDPEKISAMTMREILEHCCDVRVDDGGNAQNMAINACLAGIGHFRDRLRMTIMTTSDPFKRAPVDLRDELKARYPYIPLSGIPDRVAFHLPWKEGSESGTFAMITDPQRIHELVECMLVEREEIRSLFADVDTFVTTEPMHAQIQRYATRPYTYLVNAASAYRSMVATESYKLAAVLPMNKDEAADVSHHLLQRSRDVELHDIVRPIFPSPLATNGSEIDKTSLRELDKALSEYATHNPAHSFPGRIAFTYPITFGAEGGLVVGVGQGNIQTACFTTAVHPDKEKELLDEFGEPSKMYMNEKQVMGAGDSTATIIALFNTIDPKELIESHMQGREKENDSLRELASTVFVSTLSRIVGNFLIHTQQCNWSNIKSCKFASLFDEVAKESLCTARSLVKH